MGSQDSNCTKFVYTNFFFKIGGKLVWQGPVHHLSTAAAAAGRARQGRVHESKMRIRRMQSVMIIQHAT